MDYKYKCIMISKYHNILSVDPLSVISKLQSLTSVTTGKIYPLKFDLEFGSLRTNTGNGVVSFT